MSTIITHLMQTKFTVIGSASRSSNTAHVNMMRHAEMMGLLSSAVPASLRHTIQPVTGFYQEADMTHDPADWEKCFESSVMFGVDSEQHLALTVRLFCSTYQQDCVLVQDNDTGEITLRHPDWEQSIGTKWRKYSGINVMDSNAMADFVSGHNAFTILPCRTILEVVAQ